jgi:tRNA threonylcarbamoyladenosine biosynthesis protein TsaB
MLLAIDTATRVASIALYEPDRVLAEYTWRTGDNHTVELMPSLVEMLERQGTEPNQLDGVAVALGPGSFTGLRVGLAVAKALASSVDIPLVGVPTLEILPHAVREMSLPIWSVIQAGRGRICYAEYRHEDDTWVRRSDIEVGTTEELIGHVAGFAVVCGELDSLDVEAIRARLGDAVVITPPVYAIRRAAFLADLAWRRLARGEKDDIVTLSPIYMHRPEALGQP